MKNSFYRCRENVLCFCLWNIIWRIYIISLCEQSVIFINNARKGNSLCRPLEKNIKWNVVGPSWLLFCYLSMVRGQPNQKKKKSTHEWVIYKMKLSSSSQSGLFTSLFVYYLLVYSLHNRHATCLPLF